MTFAIREMPDAQKRISTKMSKLESRFPKRLYSAKISRALWLVRFSR